MKLDYHGVPDDPFLTRLVGGAICHSRRGEGNWIPEFTLSDGRLRVGLTETEARDAITELQIQLREYEDGTLEKRIRGKFA
jgi:hypothetical protein